MRSLQNSATRAPPSATQSRARGGSVIKTSSQKTSRERNMPTALGRAGSARGTRTETTGQTGLSSGIHAVFGNKATRIQRSTTSLCPATRTIPRRAQCPRARRRRSPRPGLPGRPWTSLRSAGGSGSSSGTRCSWRWRGPSSSRRAPWRRCRGAAHSAAGAAGSRLTSRRRCADWRSRSRGLQWACTSWATGVGRPTSGQTSGRAASRARTAASASRSACCSRCSRWRGCCARPPLWRGDGAPVRGARGRLRTRRAATASSPSVRCRPSPATPSSPTGSTTQATSGSEACPACGRQTTPFSSTLPSSPPPSSSSSPASSSPPAWPPSRRPTRAHNQSRASRQGSACEGESATLGTHVRVHCRRCESTP
mmetsp:Transcript_21589/g.68966  ORF Transcript_21589/g.68966 Transcript_21589/m.68966 type:complete len:368 (-) Transcript_21589:187-1290(-)